MATRVYYNELHCMLLGSSWQVRNTSTMIQSSAAAQMLVLPPPVSIVSSGNLVSVTSIIEPEPDIPRNKIPLLKREILHRMSFGRIPSILECLGEIRRAGWTTREIAKRA